MSGLRGSVPEIEVINGALLVAHIDIEGEEIDGCSSAPAEHLGERRQPIAIHIGMYVLERV